MKKILPLLFTCLFMTSSSYASTSLGPMPCGKVISSNDEGVDLLIYYNLGWIRGYISARNFENNRTIENIDADSIKYALIKYCKDNPLMYSDDAANSIYSQIR
jgi:hypothetical protein